jgi:hypothetical protein
MYMANYDTLNTPSYVNVHVFRTIYHASNRHALCSYPFICVNVQRSYRKCNMAMYIVLLWFFVSFRNFFSDNTRLRIFFFVARSAKLFVQNLTLYDKDSESDYCFFPPPKSDYFFQQHWESEYFF